MDWELAQVNVAATVAALESPRLSGFRRLAGPLDDLARRSPGFVWRPDPAGVDPAELAAFGDLSRVVPNLSVWESLEALRHYVFGTAHADALRRRRRWFLPSAAASTALWWVPAGERPSFAEAHRRLELLRADGPSPDAFPLSHPHGPPGQA